LAARRLTDDEMALALARLPEWSLHEGRLRRTYQFRDFVEAFAFMTAAALRIQELDHHPEWFNVYNTVRVDLVTHDAEGVTARDVELAARLEELAGRWPK
jgi:4a-hydroxytetrahydrobiopterin dehydratase